VGEAIGDGFRITGMVEKPSKGTAPSNFFINGRYLDLTSTLGYELTTRKEGSESQQWRAGVGLKLKR
ncbi:hypothetical protein AB9F35_36450, partial [Rhizobium leguminosarum]